MVGGIIERGNIESKIMKDKTCVWVVSEEKKTMDE